MVMKLTYFNGRGSAEIARLLLAYGEVDFEDNRINSADWPAMKETTPFGVIPILEVDGAVIAESNTICRFIAKKVGLYGEDPLEQAQVDMVIDNISDLTGNYMRAAYPKNNDEMEKVVKAINEEKIPNFVRRAEKLLQSRGGKHFAGDKLSWADIAMYYMLNSMVDPTDPFLTKYMKDRLGNARLKALDDAPALKALVEAVAAEPKIKKWLDARPGNDKENF